MEKAERKLASERRNLLDAVAGNGSRSPGLFEKPGEVEAEYDQVTRRIEELRAELAALDHQAIDEKDLRAALASFEPVWQELFPSRAFRNDRAPRAELSARELLSACERAADGLLSAWTCELFASGHLREEDPSGGSPDAFPWKDK